MQAPGADDTLSKTSVVEMSNKILGVLIPLGSVVAVLMAAYLGIKFMTGGAERQKQNVKRNANSLCSRLYRCIWWIYYVEISRRSAWKCTRLEKKFLTFLKRDFK